LGETGSTSCSSARNAVRSFRWSALVQQDFHAGVQRAARRKKEGKLMKIPAPTRGIISVNGGAGNLGGYATGTPSGKNTSNLTPAATDSAF